MGNHQHPGVHWQSKSSLLCFLGGFLMGLIAVLRMLTRGKVTGISGFFQTTVKLTFENWEEKILSSLFIGGLVVGGAIGRTYLSQAFEDWSGLPLERLIIAGFFVGYGTVIGNGCTSGHGLCGVASFRVRSFVATCIFFIVAIVIAMATNTSSYLPIFVNKLDTTTASVIFIVFVGVALFSTLLAKSVSHLDSHHYAVTIVRGLTECLYGISFAIAMMVSNMTKLSAVISFLDLRYWNPALAFIMMPAIPLAIIGFYYTKSKLDSPFLEKNFSSVAFHSVDCRLIFGALLFGIGWGLVGACPGPAIANLGSGNIPPIIYCGSIATGMWIQHATDPFLPNILRTGGKIIFHVGGNEQPIDSLSTNNNARNDGGIPPKDNNSGAYQSVQTEIQDIQQSASITAVSQVELTTVDEENQK